MHGMEAAVSASAEGAAYEAGPPAVLETLQLWAQHPLKGLERVRGSDFEGGRKLLHGQNMLWHDYHPHPGRVCENCERWKKKFSLFLKMFVLSFCPL